MARQARVKSKTGIYHIMLRGNERKAVFQDAEDKNRFLDILNSKVQAADARLYAYCILDNHAHLVVHEQDTGQSLDVLMKRIGVSYAIYFNKKYKRVGHVFQDRFRSEVIESEAYLLETIRYIHKNPVQAGMKQGLFYEWSSYKSYLSGQGLVNIETDFILAQFAHHKPNARKQFIAFHSEEDVNQFLDIGDASTEEMNVEQFIEETLRAKKWTKEDLKRGENADLIVALLKTLKEKFKISGREIAELTGINREKVRKYLCQQNRPRG